MLHDPFKDVTDAESLTLYHVSRRGAFEGEFLRPDMGKEREINGIRAKWLYATPYISKTLIFAFDWTSEAIIGGSVAGTDQQFITICERSKTMRKDVSFKVYAFDGRGHGFQKTLSGEAYIRSRYEKLDTREFVTQQLIPISALRLAHEVNSINDAMKLGLQIFSTEKTKQELMNEDFLGERYYLTPLMQWYASLPARGFTWENGARNVNAHPVVRKLLEEAG